MTEPAYLTVKQLSAYLAVSQRTAYKLIADGDVPSVKIGGNIRIPKQLLDEKLEAHTTGGRQTRPAP